MDSGEEYWVVDAISIATLAALKSRRVRIHILDRVVQSIGLAGAAAPVEEEGSQGIPTSPPPTAATGRKEDDDKQDSASDDSPVQKTPTKKKKGRAPVVLIDEGSNELPDLTPPPAAAEPTIPKAVGSDDEGTPTKTPTKRRKSSK